MLKQLSQTAFVHFAVLPNLTFVDVLTKIGRNLCDGAEAETRGRWKRRQFQCRLGNSVGSAENILKGPRTQYAYYYNFIKKMYLH